MAEVKSTSSGGGELLYYPVSPESPKDYNAYLQLTCHDYSSVLYGSSLKFLFKEEAQRKSEKSLQANINKQIFLPIPNSGLGVRDSLMYSETKGGVSLDTKSFSIIMDSIRKAGVVGNVANAYEDVASTQFGRTLNQFLVHTFKGISLREYTYSWTLIPYSKDDADSLNNIIKSIRKASLPEYQPDNWTIEYPDYWIIKPIVNGEELFKLNYLVVSDVKVEYGGEGQVTFFKDGNPTQVNLSITFKEVYPQGSEMYSDNNANSKI